MSEDHDLASGTHAAASGPDRTAPLSGSSDPLSDVLRTIRLKGALFFLVNATDPWCIDVPHASRFADIILPGARHMVSYHIAVEGTGHAEVPGGECLPFSAGDILVIPHADPYTMYSAPGVPPEFSPAEIIAFFRQLAAGNIPFIVNEGGGGQPEARFICGFLGCDMSPFNPLFSELPALLHVRRRDDAGPDLLDRLVELAMAEMTATRLGGQSIRLGLSELMFIEVLRRHMGAVEPDGPGWLAGLREPAVGRALEKLHAEPARDWSLDELARETGVSRSVLAERFQRSTGETPIRYLSKWRMQLAARHLTDGDEKVAYIAEQVGFRSEAAFSRGFKKMTGYSPSDWRRRRTPVAGPADDDRRKGGRARTGADANEDV